MVKHKHFNAILDLASATVASGVVFYAYSGLRLRHPLGVDVTDSLSRRFPGFKRAGERNSNNMNFEFWQQDNHPFELYGNEMLKKAVIPA